MQKLLVISVILNTLLFLISVRLFVLWKKRKAHLHAENKELRKEIQDYVKENRQEEKESRRAARKEKRTDRKEKRIDRKDEKTKEILDNYTIDAFN